VFRKRWASRGILFARIQIAGEALDSPLNQVFGLREASHHPAYLLRFTWLVILIIVGGDNSEQAVGIFPGCEAETSGLLKRRVRSVSRWRGYQ